MEIAKGIKIVGAQPCLYLKDIDALVIADLHLGYETVKAETEGIFVPQVQSKIFSEMMRKILTLQEASTIIINGDVKHEFSEGSYREYKEMLDFLALLSKKFKRVLVIKGNHDNFIIRATRRFENVELADERQLGDFFFAHGHRPIDLKKIKAKTLILAHEHPSLVLYDELGVKEKVKCFLHGKIKSKNVVVLPAMSMFSLGTSVNAVSRQELLSPLLQKHGVESLQAVGLIEGEECLKFSDIRRMREMRN